MFSLSIIASGEDADTPSREHNDCRSDSNFDTADFTASEPSSCFTG